MHMSTASIAELVHRGAGLNWVGTTLHRESMTILLTARRRHRLFGLNARVAEASSYEKTGEKDR
jgi:hypothetical protein